LPVYKKKVKKGPKKDLILPLFPRYIFIKIISQWRSALSTFGVSSVLLSCDGTPAKLSSIFIEMLKRSEGRDGLIKLKEHSSNRYVVGQKLRITSGPFTGESVIYQRSSAHDREVVLLSLLGREVPMRIESEKLSVPAL